MQFSTQRSFFYNIVRNLIQNTCNSTKTVICKKRINPLFQILQESQNTLFHYIAFSYSASTLKSSFSALRLSFGTYYIFTVRRSFVCIILNIGRTQFSKKKNGLISFFHITYVHTIYSSAINF